MPLSLEQLTTPLTVDEAKASIYGVLAAVGVRTSTWKPGAVVRTIIAACSIIFASFSELMALIAKSGFLELAEGEWLAVVAKYVFGVDKEYATFAPGEVVITNTAGGVFDPDDGDVIVKNTATGKTYRTVGAFHLSAGPGTSVTVGIVATEAGSASSSGAGAIDDFETPMVGCVVTNLHDVVGLDDQSDPDLRTVCLEKRSALSPNGPRDAYAYFAKKAIRVNGTPVGVTRVRVSPSSSTGLVTVTVATPSGAVSGTAGDPSTDLGAIDRAIKLNAVPDGVTEVTQSATPHTIAITYEIWAYASVNLTDVQIQALVEGRLRAFITTQPVGGNVIGADPGKVFVDAIRTTIGASRPEIFHVVVSLPAADEVISAAEVPMLGSVVPTAIHRVST